MDTVSITQLKIRPAKVLSQADDYPIAVENRNKITAYLVGKGLFEKITSFIEDYIDRSAVETTDFKKGKNFDLVAKELGI